MDQLINQVSEDAIKKYMDNNLIGDMYQQGRTAFADKIHEETSILPTERQSGKLPHVSPICLIRIPLDYGKQYQSCVQVQTARKQQDRYIKGKSVTPSTTGTPSATN